MKSKKFSAVFLIFLSLYTVVCFAEPVSNPAVPALLQEGLFIPDTSWVNIRLNAETRYTNSLSLRPAESISSLSVQTPQLSGWLSTGGIVLNIRERADIYAAFGGGRMKFDFQNAGQLYQGKSESGFYWAVGSRVSLIEVKNLTIGVDVNYQRHEADSLYFLRNDQAQENLTPTLCLSEFQINVAAAYFSEILTPYFGVSYNNVKLDVTPFSLGNMNYLEFKSDDLVGIFLGTSFSNRSIFFLNCEVRLINETSFLISGDFRF